MIRKTMFALVLLTLLGSAVIADPIVVGAGRQPQVAFSANEVAYVVFGRPGQILMARSTDSAQTFGPATVVADVSGMPLGMRRGPRIATTKDTVVVTAIESAQGGGKDGDLFAWVSTDRGITWKKSGQALNSVPSVSSERPSCPMRRIGRFI